MLNPTRLLGAIFLVVLMMATGCGVAVLPEPFNTPIESRLVSEAPYLPGPDGQTAPAALAMVLTHIGQPTTVEEVVTELGNKKSYSALSLVQASKQLGAPAADHFYGNPEYLVEAIKKSKLPIVRLGLPIGQLKANDYAVVVGYTPSGIVLNSGEANQQIFPWSEFLSAWYKANALTVMVQPL